MRFIFVDRKGATAIWSVIHPIARALVGDGHEVCLARFDDGAQRMSPPPPDGVAIRDIEVPRKRSRWSVLLQQQAFGQQFGAELRRLRPDVVHTNFCVPGVIARAVARAGGIATIVTTQHELYGSMNPLYRAAVRLTERQADAVVYVSAAVAASFGRPDAGRSTRIQGRGRTRHLVIPNGVDTDALACAQRTAGPVEPGKLVCVGRLIDVKGQRLLIEALPAILTERPDAWLALVGEGPDENRLRAAAAQAGVGDRVALLGWLPHHEALRQMATAEAVVVPSRPVQEGFGLALVEAMGIGAPVIASRIPVFEEIAGETSSNVRFFQNDHAAALARAVTEVLARPYAPSARPGPDPRVESRFSIRRMVDSYMALYDALATGQRSMPGFAPAGSTGTQRRRRPGV